MNATQQATKLPPTTGFRYETTEPTAVVKLPLGVHKLRLTVVDDAGMRSEPDPVIITVERVGQPVITHVDPSRGRRGDAFDLLLVGEYLGDATAVRIFRGDEEEPRIQVKIMPGGDGNRLPLRMQILEHAGLGPRLMEVTTPRGIGTAKFVVVTDEKPRIINLTPTWLTPAGERSMAARIEGDHMEEANLVRLQVNGVDDPWVVAKVRQANREYIDADVRVSADAAFGQRAIKVESPTGTAANPPDVFLSIRPGAVQIGIMVLGIIAAFLHIAWQFSNPSEIPAAVVIGSGVVYLILLAILYWPAQAISRVRTVMRWLAIIYTSAILIAWVVLGPKNTAVEFITWGIELALIVLLFMESRQASLGSRGKEGA
jgi:hypothetical protein